MGRLGQLSWKVLIGVIIGLVVSFLLFSGAKKFGSGEASFKARVVKENALLLSSLSSLPGNLLVIYPFDISGSSFDFRGGQAVLFEGVRGAESFLVSYPFVSASNFRAGDVVEDRARLSLAQVGRSVFVLEDQSSFFGDAESCPVLVREGDDLAGLDRRRVLLVVGDEALEPLVSLLYHQLKSDFVVGCLGCREVPSLGDEDVFLRFVKGADAHSFEARYGFVSGLSLESKAVGCEVMNSVLSKFEGVQTVTYPFNGFDDLDDVVAVELVVDPGLSSDQYADFVGAVSEGVGVVYG